MSASVYAVIGRVRYRWNGWFGCQLESREWRRPPAGTQRILDFGVGRPNIRVTVFSTRRWPWFGKCTVTWAVDPSGSLDEHSARIGELKNALKELW